MRDDEAFVLSEVDRPEIGGNDSVSGEDSAIGEASTVSVELGVAVNAFS